jgi:AcrR family transcriptional regulator
MAGEHQGQDTAGAPPSPVPRPRGRPRSEDIDHRVLKATSDLLAEVGFTGATIQAIARRAGVRSAAIYRRWPTRIELIEEAVFPGLDDVSVEPTGNLRQDLTRFIAVYTVALARPAALVAAPALISIYQSGTDQRPTEDRGYRSARPQFMAILNAASPGEVDPDLDPNDLFDLLLGSVLCRVYVLSLAKRAAGPDSTVELLCRAMRPVREPA